MLIFLLCYLSICLPNKINASKQNTIQANPIPSFFSLLEGSNPGADSMISLIQQIKYIQNIPYSFQNPNDSSQTNPIWICGDSLFWQIVQKGKDAIPYLILKTQDGEKTGIQIPCTTDTLSVGAIAFIMLDKIMHIPYYTVYNVQWDSYTQNCAFGYPEGLLEFVSNSPNFAYLGLLKWYYERSDEIIEEPIPSSLKTACQTQYQIQHWYMLPQE